MCNCGGSTPRTENPTRLRREAAAQPRAQRETRTQQPPPRRSGGPGEPGYYWTGPKKGAASPSPTE